MSEKVDLTKLKKAKVTADGQARYNIPKGTIVLYDTEGVAENIYGLDGRRMGGVVVLRVMIAV